VGKKHHRALENLQRISFLLSFPLPTLQKENTERARTHPRTYSVGGPFSFSFIFSNSFARRHQTSLPPSDQSPYFEEILFLSRHIWTVRSSLRTLEQQLLNYVWEKFNRPV
jgi:hypothetical protein